VPETSLKYSSVLADNGDGTKWKGTGNLSICISGFSLQKLRNPPKTFFHSKHEKTATASGHTQKSLKCFSIYLTLPQITTFSHTISAHYMNCTAL
jgi:hypothetical protein